MFSDGLEWDNWVELTSMTRSLSPFSSSLRAPSASSPTGIARLLLKWISLLPLPCPASISALFTCPRLSSSSVSGASSPACASCFLNPSGVSSAAVVANIVSRKCSDPSSLTSVRRVDAKSIFCRTGAESGT